MGDGILFYFVFCALICECCGVVGFAARSHVVRCLVVEFSGVLGGDCSILVVC